MDAWARSVQLSHGTAAAICSLAAKEMDNQHTASRCGCAAIFHSNEDMSSSLILIFKVLSVGRWGQRNRGEIRDQAGGCEVRGPPGLWLVTVTCPQHQCRGCWSLLRLPTSTSSSPLFVTIHTNPRPAL